MGSLYRRGDSRFFWMSYIDAHGNRRLESSGLEIETEAAKLLAAIERRVRAEKATGTTASGTVQAYTEKWVAARKAQGVASAEDDEARLRHALPRLGRLALKDVRDTDVRSVVRELEAGGELAPRTIRHVYGVLRVLFADAVAAGLLSSSPCNLEQRRGELPRKADKDPAWRQQAVFARAEVERLLSDERIDERRRVLWGLLFLGGLRINEVTPRAWRDYQPAEEPLGKLVVATAYSRKHKKVKGTKAERVREVPIHPTLAALLARWRLSGWATAYGRPPKPEDLLLPRDNGARLDCVRSLVEFHRDLASNGMRLRRQHDTRRTFISLALGDGARKDLLRWVTHGPEGDVVDLYTTPPWPALCTEVAKLNVRLLGEAATAMLRPPGGTRMDEGNSLHETGLEPVLTASPGTSEAPGANKFDGLCAEEAATLLNASSERSKRSNGADDYEARALALGFRLVMGGGGA